MPDVVSYFIIMQSLKIIIITLFPIYSYGQIISGTVSDKESRKVLNGANVYLTKACNCKKPKLTKQNDIYLINGDYYIIKAKQITDSTGRFMFTRFENGNYFVIASYVIYDSLKNYINTKDKISKQLAINKNTSFSLNMFLPVTCEFDKFKNQNYCPKCKKSDMLISIKYGLDIPQYDSLGNILNNDTKEYYLGGCVVDVYCHPTKYCKRCDKEF